MKKFLMLVLAIFMLTATALPSFAEDMEDECLCGADEEGECIPCEE